MSVVDLNSLNVTQYVMLYSELKIVLYNIYIYFQDSGVCVCVTYWNHLLEFLLGNCI